MNSFNEILDSMTLEGYSFAENEIVLENKLQDLNVIRQFPIGKYFADFYYPENKTVLEVDGVAFHSSPKQLEHDYIRNKFMNENGYCVVRVSGKMVKDNASGIVNLCTKMWGNKTHYINSEKELSKLFLTLLDLSSPN